MRRMTRGIRQLFHDLSEPLEALLLNDILRGLCAGRIVLVVDSHQNLFRSILFNIECAPETGMNNDRPAGR